MIRRPGQPPATPHASRASDLLRRLVGFALLCGALAALAPPAQANTTLRLAVLTRADDDRLDPKRTALEFPGHPGGPIEPAVQMAIGETRFEREPARLGVELQSVTAASADEAREQARRLERAGVHAVLVDLPTEWTSAMAAAATRLAVINVGNADDDLRGRLCAANLFHTLPSERMRADGLAQALASRRWSRVLVLQGPLDDDAARGAVAQAALKRYGLKVTAVRPFKLSADPRERDLANPLLLTGPAAGGEYDVVWVVDSTGEFARTLPFRTALPRPVVGDGGLTAQAWAPHFERFGAPQLDRRFVRQAQRPMTGHDWAAWIGARALIQAAVESGGAPAADALRRAMGREGFVLDGFKGTRMGFRTWDRQLRQPLLLTDGVGVIGSAPADGILHPRNVLDTLGADAAESACKAS
jgi:ABC transporter substrate binding protein (PQQ-dependent alcohol dehydrogenase system)